jgi:hypothetical protein
MGVPKNEVPGPSTVAIVCSQADLCFSSLRNVAILMTDAKKALAP